MNSSTHMGCTGHRWGSTSCGGHHQSLCWVPSRVRTQTTISTSY
jgi:hypothetical protein